MTGCPVPWEWPCASLTLDISPQHPKPWGSAALPPAVGMAECMCWGCLAVVHLPCRLGAAGGAPPAAGTSLLSGPASIPSLRPPSSLPAPSPPPSLPPSACMERATEWRSERKEPHPRPPPPPSWGCISPRPPISGTGRFPRDPCRAAQASAPRGSALHPPQPPAPPAPCCHCGPLPPAALHPPCTAF